MMIKINLLPSKILEKRRRRDFVIFVGICGIVALAICYLFYLSLNQAIKPLEKKVADIRIEVRKYEPVLKQIEQIKQENTQLQSRFYAFKGVVERQSFLPKLLYNIYLALPRTIWLEEIKSNSKDDFVEIAGKSLDKTVGVARFIKNMENSNLFSEIKFVKFSLQEVAGREVMFFQLRCFLSKAEK